MQTVLILGASGRFGRNAAEAFWNAGWRVHLFDRQRDDLITKAQDADVIVNAWNPIYTDWRAQLPGLTNQVIDAARASEATVIVPGNLYVYGRDAPDLFGEDTPHAATNPLGRLRIEMEQAYRDSGVKTIVLRAGDFLDTEASGNWFDRVMAPPLRKGVLRYPGDLDVPHAWAFLPDLARAAVALAEKRHNLPRFADVGFEGYTLTALELAALCGGGLRRKVVAKRMSWWPLQLARPFWPLAAPLLEMRYLWNKPHTVDGALFRRLVPGFSETPAQDGIAQAMAAALSEGSDRPKPKCADRHSVPAE